MHPGLVVRVIAAAVVSILAAAPAQAQSGAGGADRALRQQVERRFDVLPLHDGVALRPKSHDVRARSIEITEGTIAIDGEPVSGAELRSRLGGDADLVLKLSYLDPETRRALFDTAAPQPAPPAEAEPVPETSPAPEPDRSERPQRPHRLRHTSDAHVRIGASVNVGADETVTNDVVCIGGSADVQGRVEGNVVVIGGTATLGPTADVSGDVTVVGGSLNRDPGARIGGRVSEISLGGVEGLGRLGRWRLLPFGLIAVSPMWHGIALASTTMRLVVVALLACIVVLLGGRYVERVGARAATEPVKAGAIGVLAELLFVPLIVISTVVLVVTIIGIPLLVLIPFAILAAAVIALVGFTAVSWRIGRAACEQFGWAADNPYVVTVTGVLVVIAPVLLARIIGLAGPLLFPITGMLLALGFLFEYAVWTIGIGALALVRFERPPAAPPVAPATTSAGSAPAVS